MNVLITGTSKGIGKAIANHFILNNHNVIGIDKCKSSIEHDNYQHFICNICEKDSLPDFDDIEIVINNAGTQNSSGQFDDIDNNLIGTINCTEKYVLNNSNIVSVLNIASVSAHNGAEFGRYTASKGGILSYSVWTAKQIAKFGAVCNSLSFGGVETSLNNNVMQDSSSWDKIMSMTPLKKWMKLDECAEWAYFFTVKNKSCTAQDLIIDNGEFFNHQFIWKE